MKFLEDVYFSLASTHIHNFSNQLSFPPLFFFLFCLFVFFFESHSVAVAARSGLQHVEPQMIYFEHSYHLDWYAEATSTSQTIFFQIRQLKKYTLCIHPKKVIILALSTVTLLYLFTNLRRADGCLAD